MIAKQAHTSGTEDAGKRGINHQDTKARRKFSIRALDFFLRALRAYVVQISSALGMRFWPLPSRPANVFSMS